MKISVRREELLEPLQIVSGVVERRQTLPILANVLLVIEPKRLSMTATDMEVELIAHAGVASGITGQATLPARKLLDICRSLPEEAEVNIEWKENQAKIRSGKSRFTLTTLPAKDFPALEDMDKDLVFKVPQKQLKSLISHTQFAMAQQDVRYYLNGLLLEMSETRLRAVATDGHRLALCDTGASVPAGKEERQIIVPRKGVTELMRLLDDSDKPIEIRTGSNHIQFETDTVRLTCKLIDGRFPDYERVLPDAEGGDILLANREMIRQSLTRASILSNEKYRGVRLTVSKGLLKALAHNPEQEEAEEEVEVDYKGKEIEIGFNVNYLLDAISAVGTDNVRIVFYDSNTSCLVLQEGQADCRYVVMPMRL